MKTKHLTLPLLCLAPFLQSCESTPPKQAWEMQPLMRVSNSNDSPAAYYQLGRYYQGQNRADKAIPAFQKALALDSQYAEAHNALGALYAAQGRYDMAIAEFQNALATSPSSSHFLNNLGYAFYLQGRYAEAADIYEKAVALNPSDLKIVNNRNLALAKLGGRELVQPTNMLAAASNTTEVPVTEIPSSDIAPKTLKASSTTHSSPKEQKRASAVIATPLNRSPVPTATQLTQTANEEQETHKPAIELVQSSLNRYELREKTTGVANVLAMQKATKAPMAHNLPHLEVSNGNGITGMAKKVSHALGDHGFPNARLTNQKPFEQSVTLVEYRQGFAVEAERLSASLPAKPTIKEKNNLRANTDIRLVLGKDVMHRIALVTPEEETRLVLK